MAEALKSSAILWRFPNMDGTLNQTLHRLSVERVAKLDAAYGVATGLFASDELLVAPPSANDSMRKTPSHGTELCSVVESMFSYNELFSIHGDVLFADRAERITFNALPGAWASPRGGDMWNHQGMCGYVRASKQADSLPVSLLSLLCIAGAY